ncbi:MAG: cytochrome c peroxidase [Planctomycetota bacterium]
MGCAPAEEESPETSVGEPATGHLVIEPTQVLLRRLSALSPLPPPPADPTNRFSTRERAATLGQALFFDERLSKNGSVSCATCHVPSQAFTDGRQLAMGLSLGNRHTPTLFNVAYHRWLTWDGRADSLWMQALDPIEDPREMGTTRGDVARVIAADPWLMAEYEAVFGELPAATLAWADAQRAADAPLGARPRRAQETIESNDSDPAPPEVAAWEALDDPTRDALNEVFVHVGKAIAAYQRQLVRADAPFDRFVEGLVEQDVSKQSALSPAAQRGLMLFLGKANCTLCHNGPNFSDGEFHNNSLPTLHGGEPEDAGRYAGAAVVKASPFHAGGPYSDDTNGQAAQEVGRLRVSSESWGEFRTPSLRNLSGRAPFMHQGQLPGLAAVIDFYSELTGASGRNHHQEQILVPLRLSDSEKADLLAFLKSLDGQALPEALLRSPRQ